MLPIASFSRVFPAEGLAAAMVVLMAATPALAQDPPQSRQQLRAEEQAARAGQLRPYEPDTLERNAGRVERALDLMSAPVYPFVGKGFDGGGVAFGGGVRGAVRDTGSFDVHAGVSLRGTRTADATLTLPSFARHRLSVELNAHWVDAPKVAFYGVGPGSARDARTDFSLAQTSVGVTTRFRATRFLTIGTGLDALATESQTTAPASVASVSPSFTRTRLFAEVDTRTSPGYTRRGGLYRFEAADYHQTNGDASSFRRFDAEVRQFIPLLRENWVIALRALATTTSTTDGRDVPFFLMPHLGGGQGLRGYSSWRFRDRQRVLLSGEYRWTAGSFVDMSLFMDAGKVAPRAGDLLTGGLARTYGVGVTFHTPTATVTRIELARTREGSALVLSFNPSF